MKTELITSGSSSASFKEVASIEDINSLFNSISETEGNAYDLFNFAVKNGFLEPVKDPFALPSDPFVVNTLLFNAPDPRAVELLNLMAAKPGLQFFVDWDQLERTPELLTYQDSEHTEWFNVSGDPSNDAYELAKFSTGKNRVGIIRSIQTALNYIDNNLRTPRGDPFWHLRSFGAGVGGCNCKWFLRIERLDPNGVDLQNFRSVGTSSGVDENLPGQAFEVLPEWLTMRFLWGADHKVFLPCPQNSLVSLWVNFPYHAQPWSLRDTAGLIKGFTQPEGSPRTYENLTKSW